ncbi:cobaltochelatase CobT-related protein [Bradyrhizobium sp. HKCCYLS2038]|uniref:cobaltochelatase CobT-related protein n=1 Tax=unclassified Bradyrhizobium TaxID=2631580 RepID=UPI003EBEAA40
MWRDVSLTMFLSALIALTIWIGLPRRKAKRQSVPFDPSRAYRVYTREFDVEIDAEELDGFLAMLDPDGSWAKRYPAVDPAPLFALEKELAARATTGGEPPVSIQADDSIVTLLIDHSGSMRGDPMLFTARAALVAADLLKRIGAKHEVLGFTTARWRGGRSREKWLRDGRPPYPGRLNDLLHIVYCSAGETLTPQCCAAMLKSGLLKENIDGEAIAWAAARLRQRAERRKFLIVLSDGAPVDDSTLYENGESYLYHHLPEQIRQIEATGDIRIAAIGIGQHPVDRYYGDGIMVGSPEELESTVVAVIKRLLNEGT